VSSVVATIRSDFLISVTACIAKSIFLSEAAVSQSVVSQSLIIVVLTPRVTEIKKSDLVAATELTFYFISGFDGHNAHDTFGGPF
jgi:hypothetical protein